MVLRCTHVSFAIAQKVFVECREHRKVIAFAVALILNCVNSDCTTAPGVEEVAARRVDLVDAVATAG